MSTIHKHRGFTLIELAVVISISSVLLVGVLELTQKAHEAEKRDTTLERMEFIMEAIEDYARLNGQLPCPAQPGSRLFDDSTNHLFGLGTSSDPANCTAPNVVAMDSDNVIGGDVPVYTLQIPAEYINDGWNNRFTYVVEEDLVLDTNYTAGAGTISMEYHADIATIQTLGTDIAVVLISHGENGYGSFGGRGGTARSDSSDGSTCETENIPIAAGDKVFNAGNSFSACGDDIVFYRTRWTLPDEDTSVLE